jgi:phosphoglycerol transferase MdoB-like AlkP superfamily enzyme
MPVSDRIYAHLLLAFRVWLFLMVAFSAARLFYLIDYRAALSGEDYTLGSLILALVSAMRFDVVVSTVATLPCIALAVSSRWILSRWPSQATRVYAAVMATVFWLFLMGDHYFYGYFKDHFNTFFWEFWENSANASLVLGGLNDSMPVGQALAAVAVGISAIVWAFRRYWRLDHTAVQAAKHLQRPFVRRYYWLASSVFVLVGARGTLEARPLSLQDKHVAFSSSAFINLLHTNPIFPWLRSYESYASISSDRSTVKVDHLRLKDDVQNIVAWLPNATPKQGKSGFWYLEQNVAPRGAEFFKKQPKHVVLIFMESYSSWVMDYAEDGFHEAMSPSMRQLRAQSLSFAHHFPPAGGTIKNFAAAVLSFPTPRAFTASVNYHPSSHKPFPGRLPVVMDKLGYKPKFYYGGEIAWHRLYQFLPTIGFPDYYAEHSFDHFEHHKYGLYDRDLFKAVHEGLNQATEPQFMFVLTLSNHPPYAVPPEWAGTSVKVPESLIARRIDSEKQMYDRINAFRYADYALGQFFEDARQAPYFDDTLFVITADHSFGGTFGYPSQLGWQEENIPLLFYGPGVLKDELVGETRREFTTHLDLVPTLAELLAKEPLALHTFGKSVFAPGSPTDTGIAFYFSCMDGYCLKNNRLARLTDGGLLEDVADAAVSQSMTDKIRRMDDAYYNVAHQYLLDFEE